MKKIEKTNVIITNSKSEEIIISKLNELIDAFNEMKKPSIFQAGKELLDQGEGQRVWKGTDYFCCPFHRLPDPPYDPFT